MACKSQKYCKDFVYKPQGFDPKDFPGPIADHPDAALWLLNTIHFRRVILNFDKDTFIDLHSKLLGMVMGDINYVKPICKAMIYHGLVESDGEWHRNTKSTGYRFGAELYDATWERYYPTNTRFVKRMRKFKEHQTEAPDACLPVHYHLADWMRRVEISDRFESVIEAMAAEDANRPTKPKAPLARHQAEIIRGGLIRWNVCRFNRLHSNYTGLCRELRECLSVDGEPLIEIDIVNSQPYFLALMLIEVLLSENNSNSKNLNKLVFLSSVNHQEYLNSLSFSSSLNSKKEEETVSRSVSHPPHPICFWFLDNIPNDMKRFVDNVTKGNFYETFQQAFPHHDRQSVKEEVFHLLNGKPYTMTHAEMGQFFRETYPTAFDLMMKMKKAKGYEWLAHEMQRREARLVINRVCDQLRVEQPDVPIVTVHDSLLTTSRYIDTVADMMNAEFRKQPFQPKMRIK